MALCKWNGGACERETNDPSGLCSKHRPQPSTLDKFLLALKDCVGVTIWQGAPAFVYQGAPYNLEPCMFDAAILQEALASGKAQKRVLTVASNSFTHQIEIIAAKSQRFQINVGGVADVEIEIDNPPLKPADEDLVRKWLATGQKDENVRKELERRGIRRA